MSVIVGVHGIAQELKGPDVLLGAWAPALRDGVAFAGGKRPDPDDLSIAFYGDLFRKRGGKALGTHLYAAEDIEPGEEQELLLAMWAETGRVDPGVPGPDAQTKLRTPQVVQRALNALSQSRFFAGLGEHLVIAIIKQVQAYLVDDAIRAAVQQRVCDAVAADTKLVIGHSLGSVVAYEALCAHPEWDLSLITLGCPLGIRNIVFDRLRPRPENGRGSFPGGARAWTNIADQGDVVALVKQLGPIFGARVVDHLVFNGAKAHDVSAYLTAVETGSAVRTALAGP